MLWVHLSGKPDPELMVQGRILKGSHLKVKTQTRCRNRPGRKGNEAKRNSWQRTRQGLKLRSETEQLCFQERDDPVSRARV